MNDLISRQAAIDAVRQYCEDNLIEDVDYHSNGIEYELSNLPSAQPEPRWIPCSERLPENGHYYLWCSDMGNVQSDYYWNGFENGMKYGYNIAAWMPLPKPYKEEQE